MFDMNIRGLFLKHILQIELLMIKNYDRQDAFAVYFFTNNKKIMNVTS
jgi:hypothetical protein